MTIPFWFIRYTGQEREREGERVRNKNPKIDHNNAKWNREGFSSSFETLTFLDREHDRINRLPRRVTLDFTSSFFFFSVCHSCARAMRSKFGHTQSKWSGYIVCVRQHTGLCITLFMMNRKLVSSLTHRQPADSSVPWIFVDLIKEMKKSFFHGCHFGHRFYFLLAISFLITCCAWFESIWSPYFDGNSVMCM